jgi:hypothetical protein
VLSLATVRQSAKRRIVVQSLCRPVAKKAHQTAHCWQQAVAMSHCCSAQIKELAKSRQRAARQRAVWRASLATGRQDDSALAHFASDKTSRKGDNDIVSTTQHAKCTKSAAIACCKKLCELNVFPTKYVLQYWFKYFVWVHCLHMHYSKTYKIMVLNQKQNRKQVLLIVHGSMQ